MKEDDPKLQTFLPSWAQTDQSTEPPAVSDADYEQMYSLLYAYRFGTISFLELLDKLETILRINSSQVSQQTGPD
jgi:hypothetical protein